MITKEKKEIEIMAYTFPNQKMVTVHREVPKTDFLGIKMRTGSQRPAI